MDMYTASCNINRKYNQRINIENGITKRQRDERKTL